MDTGTHHLQEILTKALLTGNRDRPRTPKAIASEVYSRESLLLRLNGERSRFRPVGITDAESQFLHRWRPLLPTEVWGAYLVSWYRALLVSGHDVEFLKNIKFTYEQMSPHGHCIATKGLVDYEERNRLIRERKPYTFPHGHDHYKHRFHPSCPLCQHLGESQDASLLKDEARKSVILSLGDHAVLPNRYPSYPGASLFIASSHDDLTNRVPLSYEISPKKQITPQADKTRSRIIGVRELTKLFALCDALSLIALRNHVMDGMSVLTHDHFHLVPSDLIPEAFVRSIIGPESVKVCRSSKQKEPLSPLSS